MQGLARVRVDAGPAAEAVLPLVVVVHAAVAVDQMVRQIARVVGHGLHGSRGLGLAGRPGLGLLGGTSRLIRRNLAGRIGRGLVIGELVCLGENHVVQQISGVEGRRVNALEREHRHIGSGYIDSLISRPLSVMVP